MSVHQRNIAWKLPLVWERFQDPCGEYGFMSCNPDDPRRYYRIYVREDSPLDQPESAHRFEVWWIDLDGSDYDDEDTDTYLGASRGVRLSLEQAMQLAERHAAGLCVLSVP